MSLLKTIGGLEYVSDKSRIMIGAREEGRDLRKLLLPVEVDLSEFQFSSTIHIILFKKKNIYRVNKRVPREISARVSLRKHTNLYERSLNLNRETLF